MKKRTTVLLLFGLSIILSGCIDNENNEFEEVNSWIRENMEENYLWNERVPASADGSLFPGTYFGGLLDPNDFFSYVVDNIDFVQDGEVNPLRFNSGLSPVFGRFSNSNGVFAVAQYIYPGSPADTAGLQRGDIILEVNGIPLDTGNFNSLFYSESPEIRYTLGEFNSIQNTIDNTGEVIITDQEEVQRNPVVYSDVIEQSGSKIGYLFYVAFLDGENDEYIDSVDAVLQNFKAEGITEVIVDLRYNAGGDFDAAENLANGVIAPAAAQNEDVFVRFNYNDTIQQRIIDEEGADSENLVRRFSQDPDNLGFQTIYFITSGQTSFTSELVINGLIPHMDVNIIGESTSGDFFATTVISGENASPPNEYVIVPVNLQYENSEGTADLTFGLQPDVEVFETLFNAFPIGDLNEPLLRTAIQEITGAGSSSAKISGREYEILEDTHARKRGSILFKGVRNK